MQHNISTINSTEAGRLAQVAGNLKRIAPGDPGIVYVGRTAADESGGVCFMLPGVQVHARFAGTAVAMEVAPYSGYFMVEIDDMPPRKVVSPRSEKIVEMASSLPMGEHRLTITYCNEGQLAPPVFCGLLIDPSGSILDAPRLPELHLEFVGDSITCGYGNEDSSDDKAFPYACYSNAYYSYAMLTARLLNARCILVARSGICLHYDRHTPGVAVFRNMRACYPYTLFSPEHDTRLWDGSHHQPHAVCINLGTNDCEQPGFDRDEFSAAMVGFVCDIRHRYANAEIVLLSGPMLGGKQQADVILALDKAVATLNSQGETRVHRYDFAPMDGTLGYGTLDHPSVMEHTRMAHELAQFLKQIPALTCAPNPLIP